MIHELLNRCPDCWDMLNSSGQNALHVAILNNHRKVVKALFKCGICNSLVDEPDNDGNTPLHLLAAYWNDVPRAISHHRGAKKMSFNKENQIPLDIALSRTWTVKKEKLVEDFCNINERLGQRDLKVNWKPGTSGNIQQMSKEDKEKPKRETIVRIQKIMKAAEIQLVVAILIMTVTFAAGFTLPGGFDSNDGPNKGMAILLRKTAFRVFVVSDVIAFACSSSAIFLYFFMADFNSYIGDDEEIHKDRLTIFLKVYSVAGVLQVYSIVAVVVAFVSGMYATLAHSLGLAVTVCVISCASFCLTWRLIVKEVKGITRSLIFSFIDTGMYMLVTTKLYREMNSVL